MAWGSVCGLVAGPSQAEQQRLWTLMAYLGGDGSLREAAAGYLAQLEQAGSSQQVGVVAQLDGLGQPGHSYAARYIIGAAQTGAGQEIGPVNTGSAEALADFVKWAVNVAPARRYALLIMGHGMPVAALDAPFRGGLTSSGLALDAGADGDALTARELAAGLTHGLSAVGTEQLDVIFLDCCYGGSVEVAYELAEVCRTLVASPGELYSPGLPWRKIVKRLKAAPTMSGRRLARRAIHCAVEVWSAEPGLDRTLLAVDLRRVEAVAEWLRHLSEALGEDIAVTAPAITLARSQARTWGPGGELADLGAFSEALQQASDNQDIVTLAQATQSSVEDLILDLYQQGQGEAEQLAGSGMAVLFPPSLSELPTDYADNCSMANSVGWQDFLDTYLTHLRSLLSREPDARAAGGEQ